jgi:hypothetical protein
MLAHKLFAIRLIIELTYFVQHNPVWRSALLGEAQRHKKENIRKSHLYASDDSIFGTWQRIDIPLLPQLAQYTYVLFTGNKFYRWASASLFVAVVLRWEKLGLLHL